MSEDYSELLDKEDVTEVAVETAEEAEAVAEEVKAEEAETETETEEVETEETTEEPEQTTGSEKEPWQLSAVLDEREKRQKAVAEADELRQKLKAYEQPEDEVSVFDDDYATISEQKTQAALRNTELNMSQAFAEKEFGEEKVAVVAEWFKKDGVQSPAALKRFNEAKLPFHELVKMYDDDLIMRDPAAYKAELLAELRSEIENEKKPEPSTPSLASSRSVGEKTISTDNFEDILNE